MKRRDRFDEEVLALGRAIRNIESLRDVNARARVARHLFDRYPENAEPVYDGGKSAEEARLAMEDVRASGPRDDFQTALELREAHNAARRLGAKAAAALVAKHREKAAEMGLPHVKPCKHGSLLGEADCFACQAEKQADRWNETRDMLEHGVPPLDRHSSPPEPPPPPVGGIAE